VLSLGPLCNFSFPSRFFPSVLGREDIFPIYSSAVSLSYIGSLVVFSQPRQRPTSTRSFFCSLFSLGGSPVKKYGPPPWLSPLPFFFWVVLSSSCRRFFESSEYISGYSSAGSSSLRQGVQQSLLPGPFSSYPFPPVRLSSYLRTPTPESRFGRLLELSPVCPASLHPLLFLISLAPMY